MSNYKNIYLSDILTNVKKNLNILEIKILIIYVMCKCKGFIHISYIGNQRGFIWVLCFKIYFKKNQS